MIYFVPCDSYISAEQAGWQQGLPKEVKSLAVYVNLSASSKLEVKRAVDEDKQSSQERERDKRSASIGCNEFGDPNIEALSRRPQSPEHATHD